MQKKKHGILKYVLGAAVLLGGYGWLYLGNRQLQKTLEDAQEQCQIAEDLLVNFQLPYPEQNKIDTALAAEVKLLPEDYKLHIKQTTDSIVALVAKNGSLPLTLRDQISNFREDDYMRCFWYRWGHKDILGPFTGVAGEVFPYTALDSLACVLLYPTVFND